MGQPKNQCQDAKEDRDTIKDQAIIQVIVWSFCTEAFIDTFFPKCEFPARQIRRYRQQREIQASNREPSAVIVGCEVNGQGKQEPD